MTQVRPEAHRNPVVFEPLDFITRLIALVPKSRVKLTRYRGVVSPNSRHRVLVTPAKQEEAEIHLKTQF
jgi:hypothetical protein